MIGDGHDLAAQLAAWRELAFALDEFRLAELGGQPLPLAKALVRVGRAVSELRRLGIEPKIEIDPKVEAGRLAVQCLGVISVDLAAVAKAVLCAPGLRLGRGLTADEIRVAMRGLDALRSELAACAAQAEAAAQKATRTP